MTLPSFTAEQSLYRTIRHYHSSALANVVGGVRPSDALPGGSYLQSCFNCSYDGNLLTCFCYDEFGGYRQAILNTAWQCIGDIGNNNGYLNCYTGDCCNFAVDISASSQRYKEDIANLRAEAGESVMRLRPVTFRYKQDGTGPRRYGLIAEEVAELLPDVVVRGAAGQVEGIDYQQFPALLLSALQRQHTVIKAQDRRLRALESRLATAEALCPSA